MNNLLITLGQWLNSKVDTPAGRDISVDDVYAHINEETIFTFLTDKLGQSANIEVFSKEQQNELCRNWQGMENIRLNVENLGLCILTGYIFETLKEHD